MKYALARSCLLVPLALMTGCGRPAALNPGTGGPVFQVQSDDILPGSKGDRNGILPGSKGDRKGILPGSKGERSQLAMLTVKVELPASEADFVTLALNSPEQSEWVASVDGQAVPTRLLAVINEAGSKFASFELSEVPIGSGVQELLFKSPDGEVRAAALLPALQPQQRELTAPLTPLSMAVWQLLKAEQAHNGADLKSLTPDSLEAEASSPVAQSLAAELEAQEQARTKGHDAKQTQEKNQNAGSNTGQGQDQNTEPGQDQDSKSAQSDAPEADDQGDDQTDSKSVDQAEEAPAASPSPLSPEPKKTKSGTSTHKEKSGQETSNDGESDGDNQA